jgi:hypothetical protein
MERSANLQRLPWGQPLLFFQGGRIIMNTTKREQIEHEVKRAAKEGRLACAVAFAIADKLGVDPKQVGDVANSMKIKLAACRLGCF